MPPSCRSGARALVHRSPSWLTKAHTFAVVPYPDMMRYKQADRKPTGEGRYWVYDGLWRLISLN